MFKLFKYRKYTMKFKKTYQYVGHGNWKEITDGSLMSELFDLQEEYGFEIVSTSFKDCFYYSYIKIKCNKDDKSKIFGEYCSRLSGYIEDVSF